MAVDFYHYPNFNVANGPATLLLTLFQTWSRNLIYLLFSLIFFSRNYPPTGQPGIV